MYKGEDTRLGKPDPESPVGQNRVKSLISYHPSPPSLPLSSPSRLSIMPSSLPPLQDLKITPATLLEFLNLLLEPTEIVTTKLVPELNESFKSRPIASYDEILSRGEALVANSWPMDAKVQFVEGHRKD